MLAFQLRETGSGPLVPLGWAGVWGLSFWLLGPLELVGWHACLSFSRYRRRCAGSPTALPVPQLGGTLRLGVACPFPGDLPCSFASFPTLLSALALIMHLLYAGL